MNKVKKSLDAAAGDVFDDKEELKQRVLNGGRKPKRRNPFPVVASAIVLAAIVFITFNVLQNGSISTNGSTYKVDETLYDLMLHSERLDQGDSDELRYRVFQSILETDSVIDYASSLGYEEDRDEIDSIIKEQQQLFFDDLTEQQLKSIEKKQLENFGYNYDQYFKVILTYTHRYSNASNWLQQNDIEDETTQRQVLDTFKEKNWPVIKKFMVNKSIPDLSERFQFQEYDGVAASIDNEQVLVVQGLEPHDYVNMTPEEIESAAFDFVWFHFDKPIDDLKLHSQTIVTFDPLSYPVAQQEGKKIFNDVIKWIDSQE
ncbi:hypothetical protein CSV71_08525 [Sporosarcina sp. P21c]|uniref:hypothetical protein n=1 Tax=unclassified Sporosarcina TaxID=2647733 RepID=UPI000C17018F|nr:MULTISPECIES: hypothetical protein [unclassified Sporosarcina]PIC67430.1 hypothetical protein CSV78_07490 [Sporosarcina sp. P16a]PIC83249.1 hypothetical protein CSV73_08325 [Sporosarcina sp. P1]PIC89685.1 hypothetical protein CSV71_08525 [Sporosarcina sp. P21c]PIC92881.1 hypothetical protein CSV70_08240 [Sporosarcina sp. P25]